MTRAGERKIAKKEQVNGGAGHVLMEALLNEEERGEYCRIFSQVTIEPGCELGYHEHHGETETYYVLSGSATYGQRYRIRDQNRRCYILQRWRRTWN